VSKAFEMELFLAGVLSGSHFTRQRHVRQAEVSRMQLQTAGIETIHGPGSGSTSCGF